MRCDILKEFIKVLYVAVLMLPWSNAEYDDSGSRVVILNHRLMEWAEASHDCEERNGTLLTVVDVSTMYDIGLDGRWIVWVGLKVDGNASEMTWNSGLPVTWSNWESGPNPAEAAADGYCVSLVTAERFGWRAKNCSTKLPSLCEVKADDPCPFDVTRRSSLIGYTNSYVVDIDLESCRSACLNSTSFRCLSFEYNEQRRICQLSEKNRWMHQSQFAFHDPEWDYYHLDCYTNEVNQSFAQPPTTSTEPTTVPATTEQFCFSLEQLLPTENATRQIEEAIQELQDLQIKYKKKRLLMKKESVPDFRPSATYMGSAAVVIVSVILGLIVGLDILTLARHCCQKAQKAKTKKYADLTNNMAKQAGHSILAERRLRLSSVEHLVVGGYGNSKMVNGGPGPASQEIEDATTSSTNMTRGVAGSPTSSKSGASHHWQANGSAIHHNHDDGYGGTNNVIGSDWVVDESFDPDNYIQERSIISQESGMVDKEFENVDDVVTNHIGDRTMVEIERQISRAEQDEFRKEDQFSSRFSSCRSNSEPYILSPRNLELSIIPLPNSSFDFRARKDNGGDDDLSSTWHPNTTMAGSSYTLLPFMGSVRNQDQNSVDMARNKSEREMNFRQYDDG